MLLSHAQTLAHILVDKDDEPSVMTGLEGVSIHPYHPYREDYKIEGSVPRPLIRLQQWFNAESQRSVLVLSDEEREPCKRLLVMISHTMALLVWDYFESERTRWYSVIPNYTYQVFYNQDGKPVLVLVQNRRS